MTDLDEIFAERIREECHGRDRELNGCTLDEIILELLNELGLTKCAEAYDSVDCWRS